MRLTLRTVLAYLEDALPPENAKRIGRMIARSAAARRVVRRIRKVVRRRRLIAVKLDSESRRGMDANDMAEYLDNVLPEDNIPRVERRCLKHDALLAEAAACHQILSRVLGEAPTITHEARRKAYAAVGVTAVLPTAIAPIGNPAVTMNSGNGAANPDDPVPGLPIPTLAPPESAAGRAALVSLVAILFVALGVVLWRGLEPAPIIVAQGDRERNAPVAENKNGSAPAPTSPAKKNDAEPAKEIAVLIDRDKKPQLIVAEAPAAKAAAPTPDVSARAATPIEKPTKTPPPPPQPFVKAPEKSPPRADTKAPDANATPTKAAEYSSAIGVLCRLHATGPERLQTGMAIMTGDVLANLDGSRSRLSIGQSKLDFVDAAKLNVRGGAAPVFEPLRGRFVFLAVEPGTIFRLGIGPDEAAIHLKDANSVVTFEYLPAAVVAGTDTPAAVLVGAVSHDVRLEQRGRKLDLQHGLVVDVAVGRGFGTPHSDQPPVWLTGSQLSPIDVKAADRLAERNSIPFGTQGVAAALEARVGDRNPEVRRMALRALATLDCYPAVVDALSDVRYADNRLAAGAALRSVVLTDAAGADAIRQALLHSLPASETDLVLQLLRGYTRQEFANGSVGRVLVDSLDAESLAIRELAIRNLRELAGRDFGYRATDPAVRRATSIKQAENYLRERR
jgi:hypothetical protein